MVNQEDENVSDKLLLHQLRQGNKNAFDALYNRYWKMVYSSAYKRLPDADMVKDITQEIFFQLWAKRGILEIDHLPGYLSAAVRDLVFSIFEKKSRLMPLSNFTNLSIQRADQTDAMLLKKGRISKFEPLLENYPRTSEIF